MDRYREIREIILSTSRSELNSIKAHIDSQPVLKTSNISKSNALITAISENSEESELGILKMIGFKASSSNMSKFYRSTLNLINEALVLDINIDKQFEYSNSFRNKSANRKRLILAEVLLKKGLQDNANLILEDIISKSTKYEEFDQVIEAYELLKLQCIITADFKEYENIDVKLGELEEKRDGIHKARKLYQDVLLYSTLPLPKTFLASIETALKKIGKISQKSDTDTVRYFLNLVEAEHLTLNNSFKSARETLQTALQNIRTQAPLQSREREAQVLLKIANCDVLSGDYQRAKGVFEEASTLFKKSDYDYYAIVNKMVYLDFYLKNYSDIKKHIDTRGRSRYITSTPYATAQYEFFNGALLYLKNKPLKAANWLLPRAKPSDNVSFQTQLGMNFFLLISGIDILTSNPKIGPQCVKAAFKNIEKIKAAHVLEERDKLLLRVFKKLRSRKFDFEITQKAIEENLAQLMTDPDYAWKPFSHEIIRLDEWFKSKESQVSKESAKAETPKKISVKKTVKKVTPTKSKRAKKGSKA